MTGEVGFWVLWKKREISLLFSQTTPSQPLLEKCHNKFLFPLGSVLAHSISVKKKTTRLFFIFTFLGLGNYNIVCQNEKTPWSIFHNGLS